MSSVRSVAHRNSVVEQTFTSAYAAISDFSMRLRLANWRPISTAPHNQELELRISDFGRPVRLEFPCLRTNTGAWINVDLGSEIKIEPLEWRVWQRNRSPQPHRSRIKANDRSALFRRSFALGYETAA